MVVVVDLLVVQMETLVDLVAVGQVKMLMALVVLEHQDKVTQVATTPMAVVEAVVFQIITMVGLVEMAQQTYSAHMVLEEVVVDGMVLIHQRQEH
mgnify:CR=1 FL=1